MKIIYYDSTDSPLGMLWVALSTDGLWALNYGMTESEFIYFADKRGPAALIKNDQEVQASLHQILDYLAGTRTTFDLAIDWSGMTEFQIAARKAVMDIPPGTTSSYGEIAAQIGRPKAARAVGHANATNPILFVIPCHRIIGANGDLTGYGGKGGISTKQQLLAIEGIRGN